MRNDDSGPRRRRSILVVDDEEPSRDLLMAILAKEGYTVEGASSGEEALSRLAAGGFDLLMSDYVMAGMNGIETVMKAREMDPDIGAILVTGEGSEQTILKAFTLGKVDYFLSKPLDVEDVRRTVSIVLKEAELHRKDRAFHEELRRKVEEATAELTEKNRLLEIKEKETASLNEQLREEREQLKQANERLVTLNEELERLSITDGLTKLYNFRYFTQRIAEEFYRARRYEGKLSLLMLDLDDFKKINDTYSHLAGDEVLRQVADALSTSSRQLDMPARYGGEEFVLLLPEVGLAGAAVRAERLRKTIRDRMMVFHGQRFSITVTIGVASFDPETMERPQDLISAADAALYRGKEIGKNVVVMSMAGKMKAVGKDDVVTEKEMGEIFHDVASYAGSVHDLGRILEFLIARVGEALENEKGPVYLAVLMKDENGALIERAAMNIYQGKNDIAAVARKAADKGRMEVVENEDDPLSCLPVKAKLGPDAEEITAGALVMNRAPSCLDQMSVLMSRLAPAIGSAVMMDRTARRALELETKSGRYALLSRLARDVAAGPAGEAPEEVMGRVSDVIMEILRAKAVSLYTYSPMDHSFKLRFKAAFADGRLSAVEGVIMEKAARVFSGRLEPFTVDDIRSFNGSLKSADDEAASNVYLAAPISRGGELAGALYAALVGGPRAAREDEDLAMAAASILSSVAMKSVEDTPGKKSGKRRAV